MIALVTGTAQGIGRVDVLVNCAGGVAVANPSHALARILASLHDAGGRKLWRRLAKRRS